MTITSLVLVVAPDHGFRRSLEFALQAEGFAVDSHAILAALEASPLAATAACAIVDEDAIGDGAGGSDRLKSLAKPVILLVNRFAPVPNLAGARILAKPVLGNALVEAVQHAIALGSATQFPVGT